MTTPLFDKRGGYRRLHAFTFATVVHLETIRFCKRFITYKSDPLGKTVGQMIGAARSGRQNIIEGSERAATSKETEIKLIDVARASLAELLGDFEIYLAERGALPWDENNRSRQALGKLMLPEYRHTGDPMFTYWQYYHATIVPLFAPWFGNEKNDLDIARAMIVMIQRTMFLLDALVKKLGSTYLETGGFKERMHTCRTETRDATSVPNQNAPLCPNCGKRMRKCFPRNDRDHSNPFWGCTDFPQCRGTRPFRPLKGTTS